MGKKGLKTIWIEAVQSIILITKNKVIIVI